MGVHQVINSSLDREMLRHEGHQLRGNFIDAFARLEAAVIDYVTKLDLKLPVNAPFGGKMQALKKAREQFRHPAKLDERLAELAKFAGMRANMVHSVLAVVLIWDGRDERNLLMFENVGSKESSPLLLTNDDLKKATARIVVLAHQFSQQQLKAITPTVRASASAPASAPPQC